MAEQQQQTMIPANLTPTWWRSNIDPRLVTKAVEVVMEIWPKAEIRIAVESGKLLASIVADDRSIRVFAEEKRRMRERIEALAQDRAS